MKRVLILGGSGMLGHKLVQEWRERFDVWTTVRGNFKALERFGFFNPQKTMTAVSAENFDSVIDAFAIAKPDVVVNCIGVIKQLAAAKDPIQTLTINSIFPHRIAKLCGVTGTRFITLGTDCVFSGTRGNYSEADAPDATDLYGRSKYLGEVNTDNCLTVRTSIIGRELGTSHSLIDWLLSKRGQNETIRGFTNAVFTGFPTIVLADLLADLIENYSQLQGTWHVSSNPINKFELLKLVNKKFKANLEIEPYSDFYCDRSLDSSRFRTETNFKPQSWAEMVTRMTDDPTPYDQFHHLW
ncbi:MAG: SDR family oxidoreductase [Pyrinomonadaceae bacterium]